MLLHCWVLRLLLTHPLENMSKTSPSVTGKSHSTVLWERIASWGAPDLLAPWITRPTTFLLPQKTSAFALNPKQHRRQDLQLTYAYEYTANQPHCLNKIAQIFCHATQPTSCLQMFAKLSTLRMCLKEGSHARCAFPTFAVLMTYWNDDMRRRDGLLQVFGTKPFLSFQTPNIFALRRQI